MVGVSCQPSFDSEKTRSSLLNHCDFERCAVEKYGVCFVRESFQFNAVYAVRFMTHRLTDIHSCLRIAIIKTCVVFLLSFYFLCRRNFIHLDCGFVYESRQLI